MEGAELGRGVGGHGIALSVEPCAWVEVHSSWGGFGQHRLMGVTHNQQSDVGLSGEKLFGPGPGSAYPPAAARNPDGARDTRRRWPGVESPGGSVWPASEAQPVHPHGL